MNPLVSALIPAYGHASFLRRSLDSALEQDVDLEVRVIDDGSPDDSPQVLSEYGDRIHWSSQTNRGQAATRNRLWRESSGEFVAFLDDDDWWPDGKLLRQVNLLRANPQALMVFGRALLHDSTGMIVPERPEFTPNHHRSWLKRLHVSNPIRSPGQTLIRRSTLEALGGFDESLRGPDDWDLYLRISKMGEILYEDEPALHYRVHACNASSKNWQDMYTGCRRVVKKHLGAFPHLSTISTWWRANRKIALSYGPAVAHLKVLRSDDAIRSRDLKSAVACRFKAALLNPRILGTRGYWQWLRGL